VASNTWTLLGILGLSVEVSQELGLRCQHRATEPDGEPLERVRNDLSRDLLNVQIGIALLRVSVPILAEFVDVTLQAVHEVLEHGRATRQSDVIVEYGGYR